MRSLGVHPLSSPPSRQAKGILECGCPLAFWRAGKNPALFRYFWLSSSQMWADAGVTVRWKRAPVWVVIRTRFAVYSIGIYPRRAPRVLVPPAERGKTRRALQAAEVGFPQVHVGTAEVPGRRTERTGRQGGGSGCTRPESPDRNADILSQTEYVQPPIPQAQPRRAQGSGIASGPMALPFASPSNRQS